VGSRRRATPLGPRRRARAHPGPRRLARATAPAPPASRNLPSPRPAPCRGRACPWNATGRGSVTNGGRGTSC